jgi:phage-related tail protein
MVGMDDPEQTNRAAAEHVARMRKRLEDGKAEIERQQASVSDTREHMAGMQRFLDETRSRFEDEYGDAA